MKKLMLLVLGMILVVSTASVANAASFASITLSVAVSGNLSIAVSTTSFNYGALAPSAKAVSSAITVTNDSTGYVETYYFKGFNAGVWTLGATQGANVYTLAAAFHGSAPTTAAFVANDLLRNGSWTDPVNGDPSTSTNFSIDGTQTGVAVQPAATRSLYFCLGMPTSSTTTGPLNITATITASL